MPPERYPTILLLSSDRLIRSVMKEALDDAGCFVRATGSFGTAVDMLADCEHDLLITHPYVDTISGHEAAKYLRARSPKMAVLIVAGLLEDGRIKLRAELEGFALFPPPFTVAALIDEVKKVMKAAQELAAHRG
jgi:DNA-binding NtrC family response regulator